MKVYGALEVAQLEWFTDAGKPAASNYPYRVIWVTDKKEVQVSDGSNWIVSITSKDAHIDNTVDASSTGGNASVPATTPSVTVTNASLTSIGALSGPVSGRIAVVTNKTGSTISIVNEDGTQTAANRIVTGTGANISILNNASVFLLYNDNDSRWHVVSGAFLADGSVTNAKLADMATQTIKGRTTAGTGVPEDLSATQATAILNAFVGDSGSGGTKGLVPAPSAGDAAAGKFLKADGTFSVPPGLGDTNFITNGQANVDTTGWATYADAAGTSPVDGTGGSPNVTFTRTTSSPLVGSASFLLTKDAANRQGQGASFDFTIDTAYQARVIQIEFDYILSSGTFTAGSTSADSDVTVWIYDVTNAVVIQPTTYKLFSNSSTISSKFVSNFQTASNSTSYRLIFHVGTTSASAFDLELDEIKVTPSKYVYGTPITDWVSWTPVPSTSSGSITNYNSVGFKRRVGDSEEIVARVNFTGANTFIDFYISTPSSINYDKLPTNNFSAGTAYVRDGVTGYFANVRALSSPANKLDVMVQSFATHTGTVYPALESTQNSVPGTLGSGDYIFISAQYPVQGWSSSVQTSDQADSRVVAASYSGTNDTSIAASSTEVIPYKSVILDTHAAYNTSNSEYTIPVSGIYRVEARAFVTITSTNQVQRMFVFVNGSEASRSGFDGSTTTSGLSFNTNIFYVGQLNSGDKVTIRYQNGWSGGAATIQDSSATSFSIQRLSQASLISATETVAASYTGTNDTSIAATTTEVIPYKTKVLDTHNAYNTTSGEFKVPVSGIYTVYAKARASITSTGQTQNLHIYLNGSIVNTGYFAGSTAFSGVGFSASIIHTARFNAGDIITVRYDNGFGGGAASLSDSVSTSLSITRIGI